MAHIVLPHFASTVVTHGSPASGYINNIESAKHKRSGELSRDLSDRDCRNVPFPYDIYMYARNEKLQWTVTHEPTAKPLPFTRAGITSNPVLQGPG